MSEKPRVVTDRHFEYLAARALQEDEFLRQLKVDAEAAGIPRIWISPEQAAFMDVLLRSSGARQVVEVGTLAGYAAIQMARSIGPEGRVRTIELDSERAEFARTRIAASDVAGRVEVHQGDAREVLAGFADGSADAAFIDADKEGYSTYLRECLRIVRLGGLILADNAFAFGQLFDDATEESGVASIRAFNDEIAHTQQLRSIIVPYGDGCWVGVKIAEPA